MPGTETAFETQESISITLQEVAEGDLRVRAVDIMMHEMKLRLSTRNTSNVDMVFHPELAAALRSICDNASAGRQIVHVPEYFLEMNSLVVRGYTLMVHRVTDGLRQFIVLLKDVAGFALDLLDFSSFGESGLSLHPLPRPGAHGGAPDHGPMVDEMLGHLYLPLSNLNAFLDDHFASGRPANTERVSGMLLALKTKIELFQFAFGAMLSSRAVRDDPHRPMLGFAEQASGFHAQTLERD